MRDIKFRAYIEKEKVMINVPIIDFRENGRIKTLYTSPCNEWDYKFEDIHLMQYTRTT